MTKTQQKAQCMGKNCLNLGYQNDDPPFFFDLYQPTPVYYFKSTTIFIPGTSSRVEVAQENNITIIHGGPSFHDSVVILSSPLSFHLSITGINIILSIGSM